VLARLARAAARRKISQLEEALEGAEFFTAEHAALLAKVLERIGRLSAGIDDLTEVTGQLLALYEEQLAQAGSMPGRARRAAQDAVAGTGVDMSRFRTGPHLACWAGRAPQDHQSGKRKGTIQGQERQPVPGRRHRRDRRSGRPHPDPRRRPPPAAGPKTRHGQSMRRHREHPAEGLPLLADPACDTRTSARTTTSASATPAARSPATSASSDPSASKSPSAASPNPTEQARSRPPDPYRPRRP